MPIVNEERHLRASVQRILNQDYPGEIDVTLAVGPSSDNTAKVAADLSAEFSNVHMVDNPSGATPTGLNLAINSSSGDVVVRVDGHAMIPSDYVRTAVEVLERTGADNVGGVMAAEGTGDFERAVAAAMTSKFGVGGASFHVGGEEGPALTVYLGCFRRSALERVGGYDETMERAQDWEMNLRIRTSGGVVYFTPDLHVTYRPRHTLKALARQYFDYGRWRREVARRHPDTISVRYLAAPVTVAAVTGGLALSVVAAVTGNRGLMVLGLMPAGVYGLGNLVASASVAANSGDMSLMKRLPAVFATMHGSWGAGFIRGGAGS
jgi:cellulose synthase/poly-beta-1,6-N-acetylglucosamine synthase-like glycosyltransferase